MDSYESEGPEETDRARQGRHIPPSETPRLAGEEPRLQADKSIWRNRNFVLFFLGQLISNSGTWLQNVAQGVYVLEITGRPLMVGVVSSALFVPSLLLSPHGGRLADRFDHRRLLIMASGIAALATAALTVFVGLGKASLEILIGVAIAVGVQSAVFVPTMQALLPRLVDARHLGQAVGLNSATYNLARVLGPILSTISITTLGFAFAFGLNSLSFAILIGALLAIRLPRLVRSDGGGGSVWEALIYVVHDRRLGVFLLGVLTISFATDPVLTLAPVMAEELLARPAKEAGILVTSFGLGAIVAAAGLVWLFGLPAQRRFRLLPFWMGVYAVGLVGIGSASRLAVALPFLFVSGIGYVASNTTLTAGLLDEAPEPLRGRIMGLWAFCFLGTRPIAAFIDGVIADMLSARVPFLMMVLPVLLMSVLASRLLSSPREEAVDS